MSLRVVIGSHPCRDTRLSQIAMNAMSEKSTVGPKIIALLVIALIVLHQDNWFWESSTLVFGMVPITLFYHVCISIAASCVWLLATKIAWPVETIEQAKAAAGNDKASEEVH